MLRIYGSMLCPDCVACCEKFKESGLEFEFLDFAEDLVNLKEFLKLRDGSHAFDELRQAGKIGIPCVVRPDGTFTLNWQECLL